MRPVGGGNNSEAMGSTPTTAPRGNHPATQKRECVLQVGGIGALQQMQAAGSARPHIIRFFSSCRRRSSAARPRFSYQLVAIVDCGWHFPAATLAEAATAAEAAASTG